MDSSTIASSGADSSDDKLAQSIITAEGLGEDGNRDLLRYSSSGGGHDDVAQMEGFSGEGSGDVGKRDGEEGPDIIDTLLGGGARVPSEVLETDGNGCVMKCGVPEELGDLLVQAGGNSAAEEQQDESSNIVKSCGAAEEERGES